MSNANISQSHFYKTSNFSLISRKELNLNHSQMQFSVPREIHKVPERIKKAMKLRTKYVQNNVRSFSIPEKQRYLSADQGISQNQVDLNNAINNPLQFQINARKIRHLNKFSSELNNNDRIKKIQSPREQNFVKEIRNRLVKEAQILMNPQLNKSFQKNPKLSPLRRGSVIIQSKNSPKPKLKITFLNIQKASLLNMYEKSIQIQEQSQKSVSNQLINTWNSQIEKRNFDQNFNNLTFSQNLYETAADGFDTKIKQKKASIPKMVGVKMRANKFKIPFDRYYYKDFIWKIAFSNEILLESPKQYDKKLKIFIGRGNNSMLIKSLMKRRSWWTITEKYEQANFIWTQIKIPQIFKKQKKKQLPISENRQQNLPLLSPESKLSKSFLKLLFNQTRKIMNVFDTEILCDYFSHHIFDVEQNLNQSMIRRNQKIAKIKAKTFSKIDLENVKIHNHLPNNYIIGNKKALYYTMTSYYQKCGEDPFLYLPETYHVQKGLEDEQYLTFLKSFYAKEKQAKQNRQKVKNVWILKPGEFTNRGNGIVVCLSLDEIKNILKKKEQLENGSPRTYIIQSYIDKPFLYQRRKFDIRHYMMITSINGFIKGYWYQMGYIRTTSYEYSVKNSFSSVHLTNDAVQKNLPDYGKYEKGNKLTYEVFQQYLDKQYGKGKYDFFTEIQPKMKKIATDAIKACSLVIDPDRKNHNFQIFGLDFMIDGEFKPWLIQINNNPCLQLSCPYLAQIIPKMVENALQICVDSLIPPPVGFEEKRQNFNENHVQKNKFQLVYDSLTQQSHIKTIFNGELLSERLKQLNQDDDETFEDDGKELDD